MASLLLCGLLLLPLSAFADDVRISSVAEPSTLLLMGVGLIGLAILGRKKFKE